MALQCSLSSNPLHPAADVTSANVAKGDVLIITKDEIHQLVFDASTLPVVTTCTGTQLDNPLLHCDKSDMPDNSSVPLLSSDTSSYVLASDNVNQPATTAVTASPNLIGRAFASAVGISVDQLSTYAADDVQWSLSPAASSQLTAAIVSMPAEVMCGNSSDNITVQVPEQCVTASVPNVNISSTHSFSCEDSSATTDTESKNIFARCEVDVSALDITMLNLSLIHI